MLKKIKQALQKLGLKTATYQSQMDHYISSRAPSTVADIERLMREFDMRNYGGTQHGRI